MTKWLKRYWLLLALLLVFLVIRLPAINQIYHQDEHRWTMQADGSDPGGSPHPPMTLFLLKLTGNIFGFNNLRITPFIFSILNLFLIYIILNKLSGKRKVALTGVSLFAINIYSIIAALQVDIDGAILPFFILLSYYGYLYLLEDVKSKKGLIIFCLAVVGGFLTKLSFLLFAGALITDQLLVAYHTKEKFNLKSILKKLWPWIAGFLTVSVVFYYLYATRLRIVIDYAEHFNSLNFASRAYFDLVFKIFKSFVWLSPLLTLPVLCGLFNKETLNKYRVWFIYLSLNLIFYLVLFDFTTMTIERYFMFLIIPSVLISAQVISNLLEKQHICKNFYVIAGAVFILVSYVILSLPHDVIPLNPKMAYVDRIKALDFSFLIPFSGGSGPIGFYFSAWFILVSWFIGTISLMGAVFSKKKRDLFLATFIVFGLGYNALFASEYLFGNFYGSVDKVAKETIEYVNSNNNIKGALTYYDIGAYDLKINDKYGARFYTAPKRDYTPRMNAYRGHYMIVDFPAIGEQDRYWKLLIRCNKTKQFTDKKINSYIFDCSNLK